MDGKMFHVGDKVKVNIVWTIFKIEPKNNGKILYSIFSDEYKCITVTENKLEVIE